jgi:hypothetical protein
MAAVGLFDRSQAPGPDDFGHYRADQGFQHQDRFHARFLVDGEPTAMTAVTQVNAGRAYVRVQLAGTAQGVSMHPRCSRRCRNTRNRLGRMPRSTGWWGRRLRARRCRCGRGWVTRRRWGQRRVAGWRRTCSRPETAWQSNAPRLGFASLCETTGFAPCAALDGRPAGVTPGGRPSALQFKSRVGHLLSVDAQFDAVGAWVQRARGHRAQTVALVEHPCFPSVQRQVPALEHLG